MNRGGIITGSVVALAIGFAFGMLRPVELPESDLANGEKDEGPITFEGHPSAPGNSADAVAQDFGKISCADFSEAQPRLEELLTEYSQLSRNLRYSHPLPAARLLDEIERIFSRANAEELEAFLATATPEKTPSDIFEIALTALARQSPTRAAEAGIEFWSGKTQHPVGLLSLVREWERQDSAAVARWIDSLEDETLQSRARHSLFSLEAASDPEKLLRNFEEIDPAQGSGIALVLGYSLDLSEMPGAAELILAEREDGTNAMAMLPGFLSEWGERDPEGMMEWLFSQDLDKIGPQHLQSALGKEMLRAPGNFLKKVGPVFAENPALRKVAGQAWWSWLASDENPEGAVEWLGENSELAVGFAGYEIADWATSDESWNTERTALILDSFALLPETDRHGAFAQDFFERLSRYQPTTVLPYAMEHLPLGTQRNSTISRAVGNWARLGEPEAAVNWSLENLKGDNARYDALRFAFGSWSENAPQAAAKFALTLPEKDRNSAMSGLGYNWVRKDPDGVVSFLREAADPLAVSELTRDAFRQFGENKDGAAFLSTAIEMPPGKMRHDAVRGLFGGWALSDTNAAAESLKKVPEGGLKNTAIMGFNSFAARRDPALAMDLAAQISVPAARDRELLFRGRAWIKKDAKVAKAAILNNPAIPISVKTELTKEKP